jgi:hypothetical protein
VGSTQNLDQYAKAAYTSEQVARLMMGALRDDPNLRCKAIRDKVITFRYSPWTLRAHILKVADLEIFYRSPPPSFFSDVKDAARRKLQRSRNLQMAALPGLIVLYAKYGHKVDDRATRAIENEMGKISLAVPVTFDTIPKQKRDETKPTRPRTVL